MFPKLTPTELEAMIVSHTPMFAELEKIIAEFRDMTNITPDGIDYNMRRLGGFYATIITSLAKIEAEHSIMEDAEFIKTLDTITTSGTKVNSTVLSKQVDKSCTVVVADYLRADKIYKAYLSSCDRLISICQSSLKALEKERFNTMR